MGASSEESNRGGKIWLIFIFLAVPIIAFIAAKGIEWKLDSTLRSVLFEQYPEQAVELSHVSFAAVCSDFALRGEFNDTCKLSDRMGLMKFGAILASILGIGLLIVIKIAGKIARGSRNLLLFIFKPGLHLTMLILSFLTILHAVLGMSAIYYGEAALIGRIHVGIMFAIGVGALFGVFAMLHAQFSSLQRATTTVLGKKLDAEQHPKIWRFVTDLAKQMNAEKPQTIVAGLEPNFYVTEANVTCLDGTMQGRTMYVSIPLCRILSADEMKAVLGHELAHYKGLDTRFSRKFYPIYRGATQGLVSISNGLSEKAGAGSIALLPAFMTLTYFLNAFADSEKEISRERELAADSEATKLEGARNLAAALVKIHAFSGAWFFIREGMVRALGAGKQLINASSLFADTVRKMEKAEALGNLSEDGPSHPTDSHPPLSQRLKNLNLTLNDVLKDAKSTSPKNSAVNLFDNVETLEEELTEVEHAIMLRMGQVKIGTDDQPPVENPEEKKS